MRTLSGFSCTESHGTQVGQLQGKIRRMAEQMEAGACKQAEQLHASVEQERRTWDQLCR